MANATESGEDADDDWWCGVDMEECGVLSERQPTASELRTPALRAYLAGTRLYDAGQVKEGTRCLTAAYALAWELDGEWPSWATELCEELSSRGSDPGLPAAHSVFAALNMQEYEDACTMPALLEMASDPNSLDWTYSKEGGYGDAVDAAAVTQRGDLASLWAVFRSSPELLADVLAQPDFRVSSDATRVEAIWRPCGMSHIVPNFLKELVVFDIGLPLVRVGAHPGRADFEPHRYYGDGGYVMVPPTGAEVCYSYGISHEVSFDSEVVLSYGV